jgi:hypothetical protein
MEEDAAVGQFPGHLTSLPVPSFYPPVPKMQLCQGPLPWSHPSSPQGNVQPFQPWMTYSDLAHPLPASLCPRYAQGYSRSRFLELPKLLHVHAFAIIPPSRNEMTENTARVSLCPEALSDCPFPPSQGFQFFLSKGTLSSPQKGLGSLSYQESIPAQVLHPPT